MGWTEGIDDPDTSDDLAGKKKVGKTQGLGDTAGYGYVEEEGRLKMDVAVAVAGTRRTWEQETLERVPVYILKTSTMAREPGVVAPEERLPNRHQKGGSDMQIGAITSKRLGP